MKILYILHTTASDGSTISFTNMVIGLKNKGIQPIIVIPKNNVDKTFINKINNLNIKIYEINIAFSYYYKPTKILDIIKLVKQIPILIIKKIISYFELLAVCKREKPDIIHTNVGIIHEGYYVANKLQIPHIWHLREYQTLDFKMNIIPSYKYFCTILKKSHVITITKDIKKYFKLDDHQHAKAIYNGIFSKKELHYEPIKEDFFLCASRISQEKGHIDVIKTFGKFIQIHNKFKLYIAGEGNKSFIEELKNTAREYNCQDNIIFLGFIKDIKPLMRKAKALIVGSYNEGFGRMTAEANFCGCLVIGRNTGGTKEILDEVGGFQFADNTELLKKMFDISQLKMDEYKTRALTAQKKAVTLYSIESNIEHIYDIYQQTIKNRN